MTTNHDQLAAAIAEINAAGGRHHTDRKAIHIHLDPEDKIALDTLVGRTGQTQTSIIGGMLRVIANSIDTGADLMDTNVNVGDAVTYAIAIDAQRRQKRFT